MRFQLWMKQAKDGNTIKIGKFKVKEMAEIAGSSLLDYSSEYGLRYFDAYFVTEKEVK